MAAPYSPPVKNEEFKIRIMLEDMANPGSFKANPTIASGDFKIDIDGAGFNNLATLPSVSPAAGRAVLIELSASEMNGDVITLQCVDQTATKEWADYSLPIVTESAGGGSSGVRKAPYLGDFTTSQTVRFMFSTHAAAGGNVEPLSAFEVGDIRVYRNNDDTQRASTNGYTITSTFDSLTGLCAVSIALSDNSDAGFYIGGEYAVVLAPDTETIDGQAVKTPLAFFSIGRGLGTVSIAQIVAAFGAVPGNVLDDAGNDVDTFKTDLPDGSYGTNHFVDMACLLLNGSVSNQKQVRTVTAYDAGTGFITVDEAYGTTPIEGDTILLLGRIK